jgi:hypothetical protein
MQYGTVLLTMTLRWFHTYYVTSRQVECMVGLQYGQSLISKPQKTCAISGFAYPFNRILRPQDFNKTVSVLSPFSQAQQTCVNDICLHPGKQ